MYIQYTATHDAVHIDIYYVLNSYRNIKRNFEYYLVEMWFLRLLRWYLHMDNTCHNIFVGRHIRTCVFVCIAYAHTLKNTLYTYCFTHYKRNVCPSVEVWIK